MSTSLELIVLPYAAFMPCQQDGGEMGKPVYSKMLVSVDSLVVTPSKQK